MSSTIVKYRNPVGSGCDHRCRRPGLERAALVLSDVLLVPFAPRSYDVWALDDIAALVDEARSVHDGLRDGLEAGDLHCRDSARFRKLSTEQVSRLYATG